MDMVDLINRTQFLGPEFLTWLWYRVELQQGIFDVGGELGAFELWFDDRLVVGSATMGAQENHFKGGHPASSAEARTALRLGKMANQAKLRIVRASAEWSFVLKDDLSVAGVKIPAVLGREDEEQLDERVMLLDQLDAMVKGLLGQFLALRTSPEWQSDELPALLAWVASEAIA
jgi:recombination associated protein RdgC